MHFWTKIFHNYEPRRVLTQMEQLGAVPERLRRACMRTDCAEKGAPTSTTCTSFMLKVRNNIVHYHCFYNDSVENNTMFHTTGNMSELSQNIVFVYMGN